MQRITMLVVLLMLSAAAAVAQDADGDTIPDAIEAQIATDPAFAEPLELLYEDGTSDADTSKGAELIPEGDFTRIWFAPVARRRYLWKIDLAAETPWPHPSHDVRILYVDADNDRTTGRPDSGPGCDVMFYSDRHDNLIGWTRPLKSVKASDGRSIYIVADMDLNQEGGQSVFRMMLLYQDIREGHSANRDTMPWIDVHAAGMSDRERIAVPVGHDLYAAPQAIEHVGARVLFDREAPRAEITFITAQPTLPTIEYGPTAQYGSMVTGANQWNNHRIFLEGLEPGREYHYRVHAPDAEGEVVSADLTFSTVAPPPLVGTVARQTVPLTVDNPHPSAAARVPITTGLPFPPGALADDAHLRLLDAEGRELPLQSEVTARWPDGSVKWALLDFVADVPARSSARFGIEFGTQVRRTVQPSGITLRRAGEALIVDTGALRVRFDPELGAMFVPEAFDADGDGGYSASESDRGGQFVGGPGMSDGEGRYYASVFALPEIEVERPGPLVTVVTVSGTHADRDGNALFRYVSRYQFTAGSGLVRLQHAVENDQVGQSLTRVNSYGIGVPLPAFPGATVTVEAGEDGPISFGAAEGSCTLNQDLDNHWTLRAPGIEREGERGPSAIDVSSDGRGLWVGLRHFWQKWPSELTFNADAPGIGVNLLPAFPDDRYATLGDAIVSDRLYYHVRDGGYRLYRGVSFTREIWLGYHAGGYEAAAPWGEQMRAPLIAQAPSEWYCASGAFGDQLPRTEGLFPEYEAMVDRILDRLVQIREQQQEYGFLNYGDWWGERGYNWGNHEYDTPHADMVQFARTGERRFYDEAVAASEHMRDVDFTHHAPNPGDVYKTRAHRMFHTGGYEPRMTAEQRGLAYATEGGLTAPLSGHQWNRGLFEHYYMTGEVRSREAAMGLGEFMAGPGTVNWTIGHGAERCAAWAIDNVITTYEATYDPFYLNAARIMIEDAIRRQTEAGHWGFPAGYSDVQPTPIGGYAWCSGLLITKLEHYNRYAQDPRVHEMMIRAAQWLAREEFMPEKKGFRSCSCETFNERTRPGDSAWGVADAMAIAYELTGDERFLDLAQMTYAYFILTAGGMGKNYSIALVTSPQLIYRLHQAGRTDLSTGRWDEPFEALAPHVLPTGQPLRVLLRTTRPEAVEVSADLAGQTRRVTVPPGGAWRTVDLAPLPGGGPMALTLTSGAQTQTCTVESLAPGAAQVGEEVGLIAGEEDFLGAALALLGVTATPIAAGDDLARFGTIFLGTQACTLDAAGIRTDPAPLLRWLHAGGTVVVSHPNDDNQDPFLFGPALVLQEENAVSGAILAPEHALFRSPNAAADLSGATMFDSVAWADGAWEVLAADTAGRPAVLALAAGEGRVLVIVPSFERYVTGLLAAPEAQVASYRAFLENVVAWTRAQ